MIFAYQAVRRDSLAIAADDNRVVDFISNLDVYNEGIRDYRTSLTPKSTKGFRVATQLNPIDNYTRRETLLARGRAHDVEFFRRQKYDNLDTNTRVRRAFLASVSCLAEAERKPWYNNFRITKSTTTKTFACVRIQ